MINISQIQNTLNGILVVNKPTDWTSFDVIAKLRGVLKTRKIGHSGTLDPMATGVLPLFIGSSARAVDMQTDNTKQYIADVKFGIKTDTGDITGVVQKTQECNINNEDILKIIPNFLGDISQIPPMYSAIKINGQPLYKLARQGKEIKREARNIHIFDISVVEKIAENEFRLKITCSKGTYIRTLLEDMAQALGTVATMTALVRTQSGAYKLQMSKTLEEIYKAVEDNTLINDLISCDSVFMHLDIINADDTLAKRLKNGAFTKTQLQDAEYRVYHNNSFFAIATVQDGICRVKKLF